MLALVEFGQQIESAKLNQAEQAFTELKINNVKSCK